jgi:endonuclease VIII
MPEGDTIWRTAAALRRRIDGKVVVDARPAGSARLKGRQVLAVEPTGKHLVMRFDGDLALHSHMRMKGAWHIYQPGERWRQPEHRVKAVLAFDDVVAVCFAAPGSSWSAIPAGRWVTSGPTSWSSRSQGMK